MGSELLYIISCRGYRSLVRIVLEEERINVDVNAENGLYGTVLQDTSANGNVEVVRILLDAGADVNINTKAGLYGTALQAASYNGKVDIVRMLLDAGAKSWRASD
jgi:ankyrin repeat protein